jgi:hypothetical protein
MGQPAPPLLCGATNIWPWKVELRIGCYAAMTNRLEKWLQITEIII